MFCIALKTMNHSQYTTKLLLQGKSWKGSVSSIDDVNVILNEKADMANPTVRTM